MARVVITRLWISTSSDETQGSPDALQLVKTFLDAALAMPMAPLLPAATHAAQMVRQQDHKSSDGTADGVSLYGRESNPTSGRTSSKAALIGVG